MNSISPKVQSPIGLNLIDQGFTLAYKTISMAIETNRYDWKRLNHLQVGRFAEYLAKMEFALYGFEIFTSEVDDRGIDFVVRNSDKTFFEIQVKSVRDLNYVFFHKDKFKPNANLLATLILFNQNEGPNIYLIPSLQWQNCDKFFVSRDYTTGKSKPEWGLSLSTKNLNLLKPFEFDKRVGDYLK